MCVYFELIIKNEIRYLKETFEDIQSIADILCHSSKNGLVQTGIWWANVCFKAKTELSNFSDNVDLNHKHEV